jgi:hypothetical protein
VRVTPRVTSMTESIWVMVYLEETAFASCLVRIEFEKNEKKEIVDE